MQAIFVTGTDTDVGKTYISALMCQELRQQGLNIGYYKAAASGTLDFAASDAGRVKLQAQLPQPPASMLSYRYAAACSPHLAARQTQQFATRSQIIKDFNAVAATHDYLVMEGAGGIICPLTWQPSNHLMQADIVKALQLKVIVVAAAGLGTINHTCLTCYYLQTLGVAISGIVLNFFDKDDPMHQDNLAMIETLTQLHVCATVAPQGSALQLRQGALTSLFSALNLPINDI